MEIGGWYLRGWDTGGRSGGVAERRGLKWRGGGRESGCRDSGWWECGGSGG